jgi:hypothetical protein
MKLATLVDPTNKLQGNTLAGLVTSYSKQWRTAQLLEGPLVRFMHAMHQIGTETGCYTFPSHAVQRNILVLPLVFPPMRLCCHLLQPFDLSLIILGQSNSKQLRRNHRLSALILKLSTSWHSAQKVSLNHSHRMWIIAVCLCISIDVLFVVSSKYNSMALVRERIKLTEWTPPIVLFVVSANYNSMALVGERTILTVWPPPIGNDKCLL